MSDGSSLIDQSTDANDLPPPQLLVTLESRRTTFFRNFADLFRPSSAVTLDTAIVPGQFWPDVFVKSRLPWGRLLESVIFHVAAVMVLWSSTQIWPQRSQVIERPVFHSSDVVYYEAPEYLPPLNTGQSEAHLSQKGDPAFSPQPVISVPPEADNRKQTIVTPPKLKLDRDVPLPNMVQWSKAAPSIPLAATSNGVRSPKLPLTDVPVVAPSPDVAERFHPVPNVSEAVVAPPPEVNTPTTRRTVPQAQTAVVAPAPVLQASETRRIGDIQIAPSQVVQPSPSLPMSEQMTLANKTSRFATSQAVVPPSPSLPSAGEAGSGGGRMIALNVHPVQPSGPVEPPAGNRRGTFAATPQGKPGGSGTPETHGDGKASGAAGNSAAGNSAGSGTAAREIPPGLLVGAAPGANANIAGNGKSKLSENPRLLADATPPRVSSAPNSHGPDRLANAPSEVERQIFGDRRLYSMTLNTPNLNSAGGSWVMHFAELVENPEDKSELIAPVATQEVSPGYPLELMRQNVQGTVTLSAVIRSDGTVGEVRILTSADERLDPYASAALLRWKFRPALKNGTPTALQAVVMIPFRPMRRSGF